MWQLPNIAANGCGYETERISELVQYPPLQNLLRAGTPANPCNRYVLYPLLAAVLFFTSHYLHPLLNIYQLH